nr:ABC transporter ATP-binding protein [Jannaschia sp. Os4]
MTKAYWTEGGSAKVVADNIDAVFPSGRTVGLLGRNGAGKSTLLRVIAGVLDADSGTVTSDGTISWPVGFAGSFHGELTGRQNTRFLARVYGVDSYELSDFVEDFAELGRHFDMPVRTYSSGMRARLAFGTSMGIDFDHYLVDEVTAVGDAAFRQKSEILFRARMKTRGAIMVTHSLAMIKRICDQAAVLHEGRLRFFEDVEEGIQFHEEILGARGAPRDDD